MAWISRGKKKVKIQTKLLFLKENVRGFTQILAILKKKQHPEIHFLTQLKKSGYLW